jgi:hypothetical protein
LQLFFLIMLLFFGAFAASASEITVPDVDTYAEAANAQEARMKALQQAETIAFSKLLSQWQMPAGTEIPGDEIAAAVTGFDVVSEQMGATSYRAKLNMHFDANQLSALQTRLRYPPAAAPAFKQPPVAAVAPPAQAPPVTAIAPPILQPLPAATSAPQQVKILTPLRHVSDWVRIRKMLEQISQVRNVQLVAVSATQADIVVTYEGALAIVIERLTQMGHVMTAYPEYWTMTGKPL